MLKKKVCLLGSFGVGKTSLVARFVHSMFSDKYHTTVGVKIDKKVLDVGGRELTLMLWDMAGEEDGTPVKLNQTRDASGFILVVDGTRRKTLDVALSIRQRVEAEAGSLPFVFLINKVDLRETWELPSAALADLTNSGCIVIETSAKSGQGVEEAFMTLSSRILQARADDSESEDDG